MSQPPPFRRLLLPLVPFYRLGFLLRERRLRSGAEPVRSLRSPVVSIGNLSTGGSGKTPLVIVLAKALSQRGIRVNILSRGYGRRPQLPTRVNPLGSAADFGDEPLLIARATSLPVYVAGQRHDAGLLAEGDAIAEAVLGGQPAPTVHLLDDGFQHRQLHRTLDILLLSREDWSDRLLPAGNLREPRQAIRRASILAIPAGDPEFEAELKAWGWEGPIWRLRRHMDIPTIEGSVAAFCGIARPAQFFAGLEAAGLQPAVRKAFPDHHPYTPADLDRLQKTARAAGAVALLTTEKDQVRLAGILSTNPDSLPLQAVRLRVEIEDQEESISQLVERLNSAPPHPPL